MLHLNIRRVGKLTSIFPGRNNAYKCEVVNVKDNKFSYDEVSIRKEEVDLSLFIKNTVKNRLSSSELTKLVELTEEYGQLKYDQGVKEGESNE